MIMNEMQDVTNIPSILVTFFGECWISNTDNLEWNGMLGTTLFDS